MSDYDEKNSVKAELPGMPDIDTRPVLKWAKLIPNATIPKKHFPTDAAWDLYLANDIPCENEGDVHIYGTGIAAEIPRGYFLKIEARSGLSKRTGYKVLAGVVDADYRGEIKVMLSMNDDSADLFEEELNLAVSDHKPFAFAQAVLIPVPDVKELEVYYAELSKTERGTRGNGMENNDGKHDIENGTEVAKQDTHETTMIPISVLMDQNLSTSAKLVYFVGITFPKKWHFKQKELADSCSISINTLKTALRVLRSQGLVTGLFTQGVDKLTFRKHRKKSRR